MDNYQRFSKELSICYFMQNEELTEQEMEKSFLEDETIIQGELMSMLLDVDELEGFKDE